MTEILVDIKDAEHLEIKYGERYRGWYFFKKYIRTETIPIGYKDLTYRFTICDFHYKFIIPPKIDFAHGSICYSEAERNLGIFRYPRGEDGHYCAPIELSIEDINNQISTMTEEDIRNLLINSKVLTFEAFKIPHFGFQYIDISENNFNEIEKLTSKNFILKKKKQYQEVLNKLIHSVLDKIFSKPNYLLILRNVLDLQWKDLNEVALITDNIIHE